MTILAVDTGLATCGWALVQERTGIVVDLGLVMTEPSKKLGKQADRVVRMQYQAEKLDEVITRCGGITSIAAESLSFPPRARTNAIASVCLCWGMLIGLAEVWAVPMLSVQPKQWQHAVLASDSKVDYEQVFAALHSYVEGQGGDAAAALLSIPKSKRNHPLDAVAVGVYAARNGGHS